MTGPNPFLATSIHTATPGERLVMLYNGAIRFARTAANAMEKKDVPAANTASLRAQACVEELRNTLKMDVNPDLTSRLDALYGFALERLRTSNISKDPKPTIEVIDTILVPLRDAFAAAEASVNGKWPRVDAPARPALVPPKR